jgi:hypothetical protein
MAQNHEHGSLTLSTTFPVNLFYAVAVSPLGAVPANLKSHSESARGEK